jgi:hypothetical protein
VINDIPDNLTPEEKWVWAVSMAVEGPALDRDIFLSIVRRIIEEPPTTEPYTPLRENMPIACQCSLCKRKDIPITKFPAYIPLALRK